MQILYWFLFIISLLCLLDTVAAVPRFAQPDIISAGATFGLITYFSVRFFNPWLSAKEKKVPGFWTVEINNDVSPTASIHPLPISASGSADNTTQHGPVPFDTVEPCILNSVFAADPSDVIVPFPGAPPVGKLTNLTAACNGTVIEMYEFVTVLIADIPKFFQNHSFVDADKTPALPAATESVYPNISLGVNVPEPELAALNTPSTSWYSIQVFQHVHQDSKFKPFVESARRKLYLFGTLLSKILSPFLLLLPKGSSPTPMILVSLSAITSMWSRTRRQLREHIIRCAPLIVRWEWLQCLARAIGETSGAVGYAIDTTTEAGPQAQQSIILSDVEAQAVVGIMQTLLLIIEDMPVISGYQDGDDDNDQGGDGDFVDTFQYPTQFQCGVPSHTNVDDLLSVSPVEDEYPARSKSRSPSPSKSSLQVSRSPPPPKLPQFSQTRSTSPIAAIARRLPFISTQQDGESQRVGNEWEPTQTVT